MVISTSELAFCSCLYIRIVGVLACVCSTLSVSLAYVPILRQKTKNQKHIKITTLNSALIARYRLAAAVGEVADERQRWLKWSTTIKQNQDDSNEKRLESRRLSGKVN